MIEGEYKAVSVSVSVDLVMSKAIRFGFGSGGDSGTTVPDSDGESVSGEASVFLSLSWASKPSTLFNRASKTSVLGPRFFGTASVNRKG